MAKMIESTADLLDSDIQQFREVKRPSEFSDLPRSEIEKDSVSTPAERKMKEDSTVELSQSDESVASSRTLSRRIADLTPEAEYKELAEQCRVLAMKEEEHDLSKTERLNFQLKRWALDRIEDARFGAQLDSLEYIVRAHEGVAEKINKTADQLEQVVLSYQHRSRFRGR